MFACVHFEWWVVVVCHTILGIFLMLVFCVWGEKIFIYLLFQEIQISPIFCDPVSVPVTQHLFPKSLASPASPKRPNYCGKTMHFTLLSCLFTQSFAFMFVESSRWYLSEWTASNRCWPATFESQSVLDEDTLGICQGQQQLASPVEQDNVLDSENSPALDQTGSKAGF